MSIVQETGLQLLARLQKRTSLEFLEPFFKEGPQVKQIIEISGESGSGKTFIALDLIKKCILPRNKGGKGAGAIYVNTDQYFPIERLISSLKDCLTDTELEETMNKLQIFNAENRSSFSTLLLYLKQLLGTNTEISLIVFDTLTAFYWIDSALGLTKMDTYLSDLIKELKRTLGSFHITILYTKPSYFKSKIKDFSLFMPDTTLSLVPGKGKNKAIVNSNGSIYYEIDERNIIWSKQ